MTKQEFSTTAKLDLSEGSFQSILNVGYAQWKLNDTWLYSDMIEFVKNVDEKFALAILVGKYNYQVNNGGHIQYFDNGYASIDENDKELHELMVELFEKYLKFDSVLNILKEFKLDTQYCYDCDGEGSFYEVDEETGEEEEEQCWTCNGTGQSQDMTVVNNEDLDDKYYKVNDKFIEYMETWCKSLFN